MSISVNKSYWCQIVWGGLILILSCGCWLQSALGQQTVDDLRWVTIPAGRYLMGGQVPAEQVAADFAAYGRALDYFSDEYPRHLVEITKPLLMAETEVTVGQFGKFIDETGYKTVAESDGEGGWGYDKSRGKCIGRDPRFTWRDAGYPQTENFPVVNVTWEDCQAYCNWLSKKEKRLVRLPTEAEWEYACRGGTSDYYSMTNIPSELKDSARTLTPDETSIGHEVQDLKIAEDASVAFPVAVKSFATNPFGLYDMHGNAWEWTADWYDETYYQRSPVKDPQGPVQGIVKVRRGGGWNTFPLWARASFRNWNSTDSRCINLGFRVVAEMSSLEVAEHQKQQPARLLFVGDIMLDNGPGNQVASGNDPFAGCASLLTDADITVGNLECVLGRGGEMILKNYSFRGARGSEKYLKRYFHAVSLANNHAFDFGPEGLTECIDILKKSDIGVFGAGEDMSTARHGLMLECKGRKILLLGYNGFNAENYQATENSPGIAPLKEEFVVEDIRYAKQQRQADVVIPFLHWGAEMVTMPQDEQRRMARRMIDAGASAVIGAHPHVTQTVDTYRGKPIVYSLGNFVFDYFPVDPPLWTGWAVRLDIQPNGDVDLETISVEMDMAGLPHPTNPD
jgi:formylglycine-generating enzyme